MSVVIDAVVSNPEKAGVVVAAGRRTGAGDAVVGRRDYQHFWFFVVDDIWHHKNSCNMSV